jgi:hypothetical protein
MERETPLAEDDFWGPPLQAAPRLLDELLDRSSGALRLWAPTLVPLDARKSLPVYVGAVGEVAELERLALLDRMVVVAVDVTRGEARAVRPGRSGGREGPPRLVPPPGFEGGLGAGSGARAARVTRCGLWESTPASTWPPGRYRLTALAADRASNDALVEVTRSPSTVDPVAEAARAADGAQAWPVPDPGGGLPRYDAVEGGLAPPLAAGVVVSAERVVTREPGAACVLYGAVRVRPPEAAQAGRTPLIPVTLVITGSETPGPFVVPMRVPSFHRDAAGPTARFAVDLLRLAPLAASPQTYFVYAFTADGHDGPLPVAIVASRALRGSQGLP